MHQDYGATAPGSQPAQRVTSRMPWLGDFSLAAVIAALWVFAVCQLVTPAAMHSFCLTCRDSARTDLYGGSAVGLAASVSSWLLARRFAPSQARVARCGALASAGMVGVSIALVHGWRWLFWL